MVLVVLVGGVFGVRQARGIDAAGGPRTDRSALLAVPRAMGDPSAKVRVVEFIDYQCPSCAKSSFFLHELVKLHPRELYLEVKYFPLRSHSHSLPSAKWVECGRMQGKFWEAQNAIFQSQPAWRDLANARPVQVRALEEAGIDVRAAEACAEDPEIERRILAERDEALKLGLKSTPTFYINGVMVVGFQAMSAEMTRLFPDAASIALPADNVVPANPVSSVMKARVGSDGTVQILGAGGENGS